MALQSAEQEYAGLGEFLRETRISQGIDLVTVAKETRVPRRSLQAIEENDFAALPAEAFARGFYVLYAKALAIDPEKVLQMYAEERPKLHKTEDILTLPTHKLAEQVGNMAERPSFMPISFLGLILLLSLLFGGFLCWYFSWNPAIYLSQKLRNLEQNPDSLEQVLESRADVGSSELVPAFVQWQEQKRGVFRNLFGAPASSDMTSSVYDEERPEEYSHVTVQSQEFYHPAEFGEHNDISIKDGLSPGTIPVF